MLELGAGLEPATSGLQNRSSAIELSQPLDATDILQFGLFPSTVSFRSFFAAAGSRGRISFEPALAPGMGGK